MQIHELNRPRRTDEGAGWDAIKTSVSNAVADATGQDRQASAASAGILDPKQKLAAVMKEPQMVKLATQYADEWLKDSKSKVQAQAQAVPEDTAVAPGTYNKKTGAAKLGGKTMTALSDLPPAVQQQIQAKQQELEKQTGRPNPYMAPAAQQPTAPVDAQRFNYNAVAKMPGVANTATATQAQTPPAAGSQVNKANPNNPNIKDQTKYVQGRAGSGVGGAATKFAKYDPATSAVANAGQGINNMVRGGVAAQQPTAPAKATGTAMPLKPYQVPGAGTNPNPTKPGQTATTTTPATGTAMPLKPYQVPGAGTNPNPTTQPAGATKPQIPASVPASYMDDFLNWARQKTAMRDSTTYRTISLDDVKNTTQTKNLKAELAAAEQKVKDSAGNPASTKTAVTNYILTALAGAQLIASQNKVASASAYVATPQTGSAPATAGTAPAVAGQSQPIDINALVKGSGLDPGALKEAGQAIQKVTRNNKLRATGDEAIDGMLQLMGYRVS
jgi:hypothetical protein